MTTQSTSEHTPSKHTAWRQHIGAWQASGLSQTTCCKIQDIKAHQFSYWKNKLAKPSEPPASDAASHDSLAPSALATAFLFDVDTFDRVRLIPPFADSFN